MSERAPYRVAGRTGEWEVVLGLEVHAQVASDAKLFSGASTGFGAEPNSHVARHQPPLRGAGGEDGAGPEG